MTSSSKRSCSSVGVILLLAIAVAGCGRGKVWEYANSAEKPELPQQAVPGGAVVTVRFDLDKFEANIPDSIELPLPDKSSLALERKGFERPASGGLIWRGKAAGDDFSIATLSILNNTLVGDVVMSNGKMFRIDQLEDGTQVIFELDAAAFPPEGHVLTADKPVSIPAAVQGMTCTEDVDTVELLVVYTEAACAAAGKRASCTPFAKNKILNKIQQAEGETNTLFINSLIAPRVKIVHVESSGDYSDDAVTLRQNLDRLRYKGDEEKSNQNVDITYLTHCMTRVSSIELTW
jgi:hypothetical protein